MFLDLPSIYTFSRVIAVSEDDVAKDETRSRLLETLVMESVKRLD